MKNKGELIYGLIVIAITIIINSYVLSKLWAWILVPSFGIHEITMGTSFGIVVILTFISVKHKSGSDDGLDTHKITEELIKSILYAAYSLLLGWIAGMMI